VAAHGGSRRVRAAEPVGGVRSGGGSCSARMGSGDHRQLRGVLPLDMFFFLPIFVFGRHKFVPCICV
jgi:hypothetical protein